MISRQRLAGILLLVGMALAVVWRMAVAPAVLGDFDPAAMPHRDRAFLSVGNVGVAVLFAIAIALIATMYLSAHNRRFARAAATLAISGAILATLGTVGLIWWHAPIVCLYGYSVCAALAWVVSGYATFREYRGALAWTALVTIAIYGLAVAVILMGGFAIFIMTVGAAPFAIALLATHPQHRGARASIPAGGTPAMR